MSPKHNACACTQAALPEATPEALAELVAELAPWPLFKTAYADLTFAMRAAILTAGAVRHRRAPPEAVMATVRFYLATCSGVACAYLFLPPLVLRFEPSSAALSCLPSYLPL